VFISKLSFVLVTGVTVKYLLAIVAGRLSARHRLTQTTAASRNWTEWFKCIAKDYVGDKTASATHSVVQGVEGAVNKLITAQLVQVIRGAPSDKLAIILSPHSNLLFLRQRESASLYV